MYGHLVTGKGMSDSPKRKVQAHPLLALAGSSTKLWSDEHADEYALQLREDWTTLSENFAFCT
jgi:hypothetical protein